eukprot:gene16112-19171_t
MKQEGANQLLAIKKMTEQTHPERLDVYLNGSQGFDLVIPNSLCIPHSVVIKKKLGIPFVPFYLTPKMPTGDFPWIFNFDSGLFFRFIHRWTHTKMLKNVAKSATESMAPWIKRMGMEPYTFTSSDIVDEKETLILGLDEGILVSGRPKDYSEKWHITGYLFPKIADESTIAPEVISFLIGCGDKQPIVFGLGSIPINDPDVLYPMVARDQDVLFLKDIDHGYLLPRVACNVTHGGCGSIGASLRAGTPIVVTSMYFDQPYWGNRIVEMGVGLTIPILDLEEDNLYDTINTIISETSFKNKAMEISRQMSKNNGINNAANVVESTLNTIGSSSS